MKIVRNLSRGRSPCQRVNHVKSGVIYFSAFIFSYDTIHVSGTIHTWNRGLTYRFFKILKCLNQIHHDFYKVFKSCNIIHYDFYIDFVIP